MNAMVAGKTALVTGGSSGIGKGICMALAEEGVDILIASRNPVSETLQEIRRRGVKCDAISVDVSQESDVARMVRKAVDQLGGIDFYVNNAAWTWHQPVTKLGSAEWYSTINTNLSACVWACRDVCRHMISRGHGSVLIIGSTARFNPAYTEAAYRVSKVGLKSYMENLAIEMAPHGIRVNMITPGHFQTRMTSTISEHNEQQMKEIIPLHRFGDPSCIGKAAVFLLSDALSAYTTGADLVIDGGLVLRPLPLFTDEQLRSMNG